MKQLFYILIVVVLLSACSLKEKKKQQTTGNTTNDSYVTVIIDATKFGFPVRVGSEKHWVYLYEEEKAKSIDTIQIKVFPMDLLEVSYPYPCEEILKTTLCVVPNDTIIAKITPVNIQSSVIRKGQKINAKWNDAKLFPKDKDYEIIEELNQLRSCFSAPPPPPAMNAPAITKREAKKADRAFRARKKDFTQSDTLKKYAEKYFVGIQKYYKNRLNKVDKEHDSLKRNFYKSYILYKEYVDLQRVQNVTRNKKYYPILKQICNEQSAINGAFLESTVRMYFFDNFFYNRKNKILLPEIYDSIIPTNFKYLEKSLKQLTLREMIFKKYPRKEIMTYVDKFIAQYGTNNKIEEIKTTIEYDYQITNDLNLVGIDGTKITFKQLREKHKGKVLYIDFWASWCNPCRLMLPESAKLHKELNSKDVVFIYLGFRDKEKAWQTACKKENLYENSFRVENAKTSTFIEKMKISSIPRYMLYDKSGKLYQKDAPRPNTNEIRKILKDLAK